MYLKPGQSIVCCFVRSKMLKFCLFLVACVCTPFVTSWRGLMLGPGRWLILNIEHCDNPGQYKIIVDIGRRKINRTHYGFDLSGTLDRELNFTYAIKIDVFQKVDGGFKFFQKISDDSACKFVKKHGEENLERALTMAKFDPPDCPLSPGPGRWLVLNIMHCDNPDQYEFIFEISRKKINRTHDCFDIIADLDKEFNFTYATTIDIYQKVDGGFKYFQTISDDSACKFIMKHGEENVKRALTMAKIDPLDCPLRPGRIEIRNFVMDYRELPTQGIYGTFEAYVYALFDERKVACVKIILNFDNRDDSEDSEEDEDGLL